MSEEKSELCELVAKFLAHHAKETNRFAEQLVEEIKKNEKLTKQIDRIRAGGYPNEVECAVNYLKGLMTRYALESIYLNDLQISKLYTIKL